MNRASGTLDLLAFGGTAAAAWVLGWDSGALVWGLWLSSLLVGYALIVYACLGIARGDTIPAAVAGRSPTAVQRGLLGSVRVGGALFMLGFFTVHFGMFHFVHGLFLSAFFPIAAAQGIGSAALGACVLGAVRTGWPLVVGSAIANRDAFARAGREFNPMTPYKSVVRMHLLIFVFAGARFAGLDNRWLYVTVLFFYFFPLRALILLAKGRTA